MEIKKYFSVPNNCPNCDMLLSFSGEYLQCTNFNCSAIVKGRIQNWISELNVKEWGDELVSKLIDSGKVNNIADLYKLTINDLASLDRMGDRSAQKCYDILWANKEVSLEVLLGALSIPMIGQTTIKTIISAGCDSLEKFGQLNAVQFEQVPGVGPTKAKFLADGLLANKQIILDLLDNGVVVKDKIVGKLTSKSICFTGKSENKRSVLEKMAADAGADVKSSVGKSCSYLVIADPNSTSSKAQAARKVGTTLITEDEFLDMIK